jgi:hypothetical protein
MLSNLKLLIAGLAIHHLAKGFFEKPMDARVKPAHDE